MTPQEAHVCFYEESQNLRFTRMNTLEHFTGPTVQEEEILKSCHGDLSAFRVDLDLKAQSLTLTTVPFAPLALFVAIGLCDTERDGGHLL